MLMAFSARGTPRKTAHCTEFAVDNEVVFKLSAVGMR